MVAKLTTDQWILKAKQKHGDKFDYSQAVYTSKRGEIRIGCPSHGWFSVAAYDHIRSVNGCPACGREDHAEKRSKPNSKAYTRHTLESFIAEARSIHGDIYDYGKVKYLGVARPVVIGCRKHGDFSQLPVKHLAGNGCASCGKERMGEALSKGTLAFLEAAKIIHGDEYDYSKMKYTNAGGKVVIGCRTHGDFVQAARKHLMGQGCQQCNKSSTAETLISRSLEGTSLAYIPQQAFDGCRYKRKLRFDFAIYRGEKMVGLVEYNGPQHYRPVEFWGGAENFDVVQKRDAIKREFCEREGIPLLVIPYWERENINAIMFNWINARLGRSTDRQMGLL